MNFHNRILEQDLHKPVMYQECMDLLSPKEGGIYIDCTLGDAGHTLGLLQAGGSVLGIESYEPALERAIGIIKDKGYANCFTGVLGNFKNVVEIADDAGFTKVNGIIFDLGYSSYELDQANLGLSFQRDDLLDMRMSIDLSVTAADLLNKLPENELERMFRVYGGERLSKKFASAIVKARSMKELQSTKELAELLSSVAPPGYERGRLHPATRVFQALRITVNDELENLKIALPGAANQLLPGGRMVIISFHSLEDQIVKKFGFGMQPELKPLVKKPLVPGKQEKLDNNRSRSAKLRVYEKTNDK